MNPDACRTLRDIDREERQFRREVDEWLAENDLKAVPVGAVVIDPEDREQIERLRDLYDAALQNHAAGSPLFPSSKGERGNAMQTALRSLIAPPKPPEPKGLGAVVEDAEGQRWVKNGLPNGPAWRTGGGDGLWCTYADIAAVKVLSEGVTA